MPPPGWGRAWLVVEATPCFAVASAGLARSLGARSFIWGVA